MARDFRPFAAALALPRSSALVPARVTAGVTLVVALTSRAPARAAVWHPGPGGLVAGGRF